MWTAVRESVAKTKPSPATAGASAVSPRGASVLPVDAIDTYLAIRHADLGADRGHTWTHQGTGEMLDDYTRRLEPYDKPPEALLPDWALEAYRSIRAGIMPRQTDHP